MELRDTRAQLQEEKRKSKQPKPAKSTSSATTSSKNTSAAPIDETTQRIGVYARRFGVMNEVVVSRTAFLQPRPRGIHSDDPDRWKSEESACQGLIAELYEELPDDMHTMLQKNPSFHDTVCVKRLLYHLLTHVFKFVNKLDSQRRGIIHQLRTETAPKIFSHSHCFYSIDYDRSTLPTFVAELLFLTEKGFSKYAPILFPDRKRNMRMFLKCSHLAMVDICHYDLIHFDDICILDASNYSVWASLAGQSETLKVHSGISLGCEICNTWFNGIHSCSGEQTPLSIILSFSPFLKCSLKAIFLHSVDHNFSNVGHKSRILYGKLFAQYKQIITSGLIEQHQKWIELIQWYNTQVFAWQDMSLKIPDDNGSSGVDEALKLGDDGGWDEISFIDDTGGGGSSSAVQVSRITR